MGAFLARSSLNASVILAALGAQEFRDGKTFADVVDVR
jgi:hypothetical protein